MDAAHFKRAWEHGGDTLAPYSTAELIRTNLPIEAQAFLVAAGLPTDAAPCLSFAPSSRWGPDELQKVGAVGNFIILGSNGAGDPIVAREDGTISCLDHDRGFAARYVNRSVDELAESLLRYRELIEESQRTVGPDAFLDGNVPSELCEAFESYLAASDPNALEPGSMWANEVKCLRGERK